MFTIPAASLRILFIQLLVVWLIFKVLFAMILDFFKI